MNGPSPQFDVFFSYHWSDHAAVEFVARRLTAGGLRVFLDRWYLAAGQPWPQALERSLAICDAVAVFLGPSGMGSWQQREKDLALDRQAREAGFPVIPVLLPGSDPALDFLGLNTWVDLRAGLDDLRLLSVLEAGIRRRPFGPEMQLQIDETLGSVCPYRGLQPFREEDARFFCGREAAVQELVTAVERQPFVALVGSSGSGKSSVIRAGLIPALRAGALEHVWDVATLVPTGRPLHSLAAALMLKLAPEGSEVDRLAEVKKLAENLVDGSISSERRRRALSEQATGDRSSAAVHRPVGRAVHALPRCRAAQSVHR